jgi:hypothetical protein
MEKQKLKQLIEKLGGNSAVTSAVGCKDGTIYGAVHRGHFPPYWNVKILKLAEKRGVKIPAAAFVKPKSPKATI